jgi:hypothetical protein
LEMLQAFNADGGVDALVVGSSIADFGFSTALFSELKTQSEGRPYRAFNFATGGAELRTLPKMYRIARTVAVPKAVFVVAPAQQKLGEEMARQGPDYALSNAPVSEVLQYPLLLSMSRLMWSLPPLRNASALRELMLYGDFRGHQRTVGQAYPLNTNGDRISYLMTWKKNDLAPLKRQIESAIAPLSEAAAEASTESRAAAAASQYFAKVDVSALRELRDLVEGDGGRVYVYAHAAAATLWRGPNANPRYASARRDYFHALASELGATLIDPTPVVVIPEYAVSDTTHLNTHGAQMYTHAAFAAQQSIGTSTSKLPPIEPPPDGLLPTADKTFNQVSALITRPPNQAHPLLRFRMLISPAAPTLPAEEFFVALRTPANVDVVVPATAIGPSDFIAEVSLPAAPQTQGLVLRLLIADGPRMQALSNPVADYEWITEYPRLGGKKNAFTAAAVVAFPPQRYGGQQVYVGLAPTVKPPSKLKLILEAQPPLRNLNVGLGEFETIVGRMIGVALPKGLPDGGYVIRTLDAATGTFVGQTHLIDLSAPPDGPARVGVEGIARIARGSVDVVWSGIRKSTKQDWIGLFPADGTGVGSGANRMDFQFTDGTTKGRMTIPISPSTAAKVHSGDYVFRLYAAGGWRELASTASFKFDTTTSATISVVDTSAVSAGFIKLKWSGLENPTATDWIGLFPVGGKDQSRMDFTFTSGSASGEIDFPLSSDSVAKLESAEHEVRIFSAGGWTVLARSAPVKLANPDAYPAPDKK